MDDVQTELSGAKILIVDDNPNNLNVLLEVLDRAGYSVLAATSGEGALRISQQTTPELVLLDVMMPGMDGYEVCRRLKQEEASRSVPVIFITANDQVESVIAGFDAGGVDYILKPFRGQEVLMRVQTHLRLRRLTETLERQAEQARLGRAVERVRAEGMAMQSSDDLLKVVGVMFSEFRNIGIKTNTCWIDFFTQDTKGVQAYQAFTNPQKGNAAWTSPEVMEIDDHTIVIRHELSEHIRHFLPEDEDWAIQPLDAGRIKNWLDRLTQQYGSETMWPFPVPDGTMVNVRFNYGMIGLHDYDFSDEHIPILQMFSEALSLGYMRFLDFQRLEADNERKTKELEEARQLQLSMIPHERPSLPRLDIAWHMATATEVGGDYYDYSLAEDGMLTITLGDATGHGMASGVVVTATKTLFQSLGHQADMVDTFTAMSRNLKSMNLRRIGMAMNMVKIKDRTMLVSSAGIPPILLYRAATGKVKEILLEGMPLGYSARAQYQQREYELQPGDVVLMMSDGLPERVNSTGDELGYLRVEALFAEIADKTPDDIVQRLVQGGEEWADGQPQDDDVTLVVLKVKR